jgi:2-keto-4-pentenoate hydratase/2-oxohepta-3-ene-1,7-dioic acid hydratase in catechol pathway
MKLALIQSADGPQLCEVLGADNAGVRVVLLEAEIDPATGVAPFAINPALLASVPRSAERTIDRTELLAPIPRPPRVFGIALNYRDHAAETGRPVPTVQTWFMKQTTSVNPPFGPVEKPAISDMMDFEVEVVVVIGRRCRNVPPERAHEVIAGFATGCDFTVRDWQRATPTMNMGKGWDTHAPFGPWLTTSDEVDAGGGLDAMALTCTINGVTMQNGVAGDMVFKIADQIAHLSTAMTLLAGDVIFTGTPAGVGIARTPPVFLNVGDVVVCEIGSLGAIEQTIIAGSGQTLIS